MTLRPDVTLYLHTCSAIPTSTTRVRRVNRNASVQLPSRLPNGAVASYLRIENSTLKFEQMRSPAYMDFRFSLSSFIYRDTMLAGLNQKNGNDRLVAMELVEREHWAKLDLFCSKPLDMYVHSLPLTLG